MLLNLFSPGAHYFEMLVVVAVEELFCPPLVSSEILLPIPGTAVVFLMAGGVGFDEVLRYPGNECSLEERGRFWS